MVGEGEKYQCEGGRGMAGTPRHQRRGKSAEEGEKRQLARQARRVKTAEGGLKCGTLKSEDRKPSKASRKEYWQIQQKQQTHTHTHSSFRYSHTLKYSIIFTRIH